VVGLRVRNPPARATKLDAPDYLRYNAFAPSVCARVGIVARDRNVRVLRFLARSVGEDVLFGAVSSHARRWGTLARAQTAGSCCGCPSEDTLTALPVEICSRGVSVTSEDRVSARSLRRACVSRRGRVLTSRRAINPRATPTAAAIHHGKSKRVLRRTLRSPAAERSRQPYAAKPRGRCPQAGTRRPKEDPLRRTGARNQKLQKSTAKNQERDVEVNREASNIDERRDERSRGARGVEAEALKNERQHGAGE